MESHVAASGFQAAPVEKIVMAKIASRNLAVISRPCVLGRFMRIEHDHHAKIFSAILSACVEFRHFPIGSPACERQIGLYADPAPKTNGCDHARDGLEGVMSYAPANDGKSNLNGHKSRQRKRNDHSKVL
ncbi:hypothetical protein [Rhizobium sp. CECT 9324]|uniref:hypothetical protein n=1 Tax=Rhizobium sp. CECT 9324 TaxID=2845820 RepID=UPI001E3F916C|nr:hypothetical protein [Rhizobium sp. CECT 9324]